MLRRSSLALILGLCVLASGSGQAATIAFSNVTSNEVPAEWLGATLDFETISPNTLRISVQNETNPAFDITDVYFNVSSGVNFLLLSEASSNFDGVNTRAWRVGSAGYDVLTPGFGQFDYSLRTAPGAPQSNRITPGEIQTFTLGAFCGGECIVEGIIGGVSEGSMPVVAAIRFAFGPGNLSSYGGTVDVNASEIPEPHTAALLGMALAGLAFVSRGARTR